MLWMEYPTERARPLFLAAAIMALALAFPARAAPPPPERGPVVPPEKGPADPLQFAVTASLYYDDNLFRLPPGDPAAFGIPSGHRSDTVGRVGALVRYENVLSRQYVLAEAGLQQNSFEHNDNFDHVSGNALGRWLWRVGSQWDGELSYEFRRQLSSFAFIRTPEKNLVDRQTAVATGGYRPHPRWRVWGGFNYLETDNSLAAQFQNDTEIRTALAGVDYITPADNTIGLQLRRSEGLFPNREVVAATLVNNEYEETTLALAGIWNITAASRLDGRIGHTERRHEQFSARDFSGPTLVAHYAWAPTAKVRVDASAWRELWTAESQTSSYVVANGIRVAPNWAITTKVSLRAALMYETRSYEGDPGIVLGTTTLRDDTVRTYQLGAAWELLRNSELLFLLEKGSRSSNQAQFAYDYNAALLRLKLGF